MRPHRRRCGQIRQRVTENPILGPREDDGRPVDPAQNRVQRVSGGGDPGVSGPGETLTA